MRVTMKKGDNVFARRKRQRNELRRKLRSYVAPEKLREHGAPDWLIFEYGQVHPGLPTQSQVRGWLQRLDGGELAPARRKRTR